MASSKKKAQKQTADEIDLSAVFEQVCEPYFGTPTCDDPNKQLVPLSWLKRDPENAMMHPEKNIRGIRASLRRRGQQTPLVVSRDRVIIKGNGTHEAAEAEDWTHIWIVVTHLTGAELKAYGVADNTTGRSGKWDWQQLSNIVGELKEFDGSEMEFSNDDLGMDEEEVSPLLAADWTPPPAVKETPLQPAAQPTAPRQGRDPHEDLEEGDKASDACSIICTPNMRITIDRAIERVRLLCGEASLTEGRCCELIAADYLADSNNDLPSDNMTSDE